MEVRAPCLRGGLPTALRGPPVRGRRADGMEGPMRQWRLADDTAVLAGAALICEERGAARGALTRRLAHFTILAAVPDGGSALDVLLGGIPDVILIGLHRDSTSGQNALRMVPHAHPSAGVGV